MGGQSRETGLSVTKRSAQKYTCVPQTTFFCTNERWCYLQTMRYSHPEISLAIRPDLFIVYRELPFSIMAGFATC